MSSKRLDGESFQAYKERMRKEKQELKNYLQGRLFHESIVMHVEKVKDGNGEERNKVVRTPITYRKKKEEN